MVLRVFLSVVNIRVPTAQGKRENGERHPLSGETQGIWKFCQNTGKSQGNVVCLSCKFPNSEDISIFAVRIFKNSFKLDKSAKSDLCM